MILASMLVEVLRTLLIQRAIAAGAQTPGRFNQTEQVCG